MSTITADIVLFSPLPPIRPPTSLSLHTQGITDPKELTNELKNRLNGIAGACNVFTFGFGISHSEELLMSLADAAGGMRVCA